MVVECRCNVSEPVLCGYYDFNVYLFFFLLDYRLGFLSGVPSNM